MPAQPNALMRALFARTGERAQATAPMYLHRHAEKRIR